MEYVPSYINNSSGEYGAAIRNVINSGGQIQYKDVNPRNW